MNANHSDLIRGIFCNRTLNLRAIRAIGYDMDYTLIHYHVDAGENRAYEHLRQHFLKAGWPVRDFQFEPRLVCRGLVVDTESGNLVKCNRFGFIKRALHGTRLLEFEALRQTYARTIVDLSESRWVFLTRCSPCPKAVMYTQLVDLLDRREAPDGDELRELYRRVRDVIDAAHMEGSSRPRSCATRTCSSMLDPEIPLALLDQRHAGKKLLLITNSDWDFSSAMMPTRSTVSFRRNTWRNSSTCVIVAASKPDFFSTDHPLFEVVTEQSLLKPHIRGIEPEKSTSAEARARSRPASAFRATNC